MGDAYAIVYLVLYGGYTLVFLFVGWLGVFLLRFPAQKPAGIVVLVLLLAWCTVPPTLDRIAAAGERRAIDVANVLPQDLSFEGQNVLVIEASSTICAEFCRDLVGLGIPGTFYWLGIGDFTGEPAPNPDFAAIDARAQILRVTLGAPVDTSGDMRFAEPVEGAPIPPFDVVIIDDNGYLRSYAPDVLGLPDDLIQRTQIARVLIEGWPDPYTGAPPAPTYRSVAPWMDVRPFVYWPLTTENGAYPDPQTLTDAWTAAICPHAAGPEDRDAFTHGYRCDAAQLNEFFE